MLIPRLLVVAQGENGAAAEAMEEEFPSAIPFLPPMSNDTLQARWLSSQ